MGDNKNVKLPPGFGFRPTDEELILHFFQCKASFLPYHPDIILDLDLYPYDPWDLDGYKTNIDAKKVSEECQKMAIESCVQCICCRIHGPTMDRPQVSTMFQKVY